MHWSRPAAAAIVPAAQLAHDVRPRLPATEPATHCAQEVAPTSDDAVPTEQNRHTGAAATLMNCPAWHSVHAEAPTPSVTTELEPAAHDKQPVRPVAFA